MALTWWWRLGGTCDADGVDADVVDAVGVDWWNIVADGVVDDGPLHRHFPVSVATSGSGAHCSPSGFPLGGLR